MEREVKTLHGATQTEHLSPSVTFLHSCAGVAQTPHPLLLLEHPLLVLLTSSGLSKGPCEEDPNSERAIMLWPDLPSQPKLPAAALPGPGCLPAVSNRTASPFSPASPNLLRLQGRLSLARRTLSVAPAGVCLRNSKPSRHSATGTRCWSPDWRGPRKRALTRR